MYVKGGKVLKKIRFCRIYHKISHLGHTQQRAYCLRYPHSQHLLECHLTKKQPQAKIPIAFLLSELHCNNVTLTSHALCYGGHLVMRSKIGAVQNQGITFRLCFFRKPQTTKHLIHNCSFHNPLGGFCMISDRFIVTYRKCTIGLDKKEIYHSSSSSKIMEG